MIDLPKLPDPFDVPEEVQAQTDEFLNPVCPRFPEASLFVGQLASWFYNFAHWAGCKPRWWGQPLLAVARRRDAVKWARLSYMERVVRLAMGASILIVPLFMGGCGSSARPRLSLRAS